MKKKILVSYFTQLNLVYTKWDLQPPRVNDEAPKFFFLIHWYSKLLLYVENFSQIKEEILRKLHLWTAHNKCKPDE